MSLLLLDAAYSDMPEMVPIIFAAYASPYQPFVDLMLPGLKPGSEITREEGIKEATERLLKQWQSRPTDHWLKVVDSNTGEIISVSRWSIYAISPWTKGVPQMAVPWLPPASTKRAYAEYMQVERIKYLVQRCQGPHIWLHMCTTLPAHRRRGAGSLMLKWGIDKADELNYDAYMEATPFGRQLYSKFGFIYTDTYEIAKKSGGEEMDEAWKALEAQYPLALSWMWRPKKGKAINADKSFPLDPSQD